MTLRPHEGGTEAERETANFVSQTWKNQGLDEVHLASYDVLLSYPQQDKPNYVGSSLTYIYGLPEILEPENYNGFFSF